MAMLFDDSTPDHLNNLSFPAVSDPLSLAIWVKCDDAAANSLNSALSVSRYTAPYEGWMIGWGRTGASVNYGQAIKYNGSSGIAYGGHAPTSNVWTHLCGVFISDTSRYVAVDGDFGSQDTTDIAMASSPQRVRIGAFFNTSYFSGVLGMATIWDTNLNANEARALAGNDAGGAGPGIGVHPFRIRPEQIIFHCDINGIYSPELTLIGQYPMTISGSPTRVDDGPPVMPWHIGRSVQVQMPADLAVNIGIASESDSAIGVTAQLHAQVGIVSETNEALPIAQPGIEQAIGIASEIDAAQILAAAEALSIILASEEDTAIALGLALALTTAGAEEVDTAGSIGTGATEASLGTALESDNAISLTTQLHALLSTVLETNTAPPITPVQPILLAIGAASETDEASALAHIIAKEIGTALETDQAISIDSEGGLVEEFIRYAGFVHSNVGKMTIR